MTESTPPAPREPRDYKYLSFSSYSTLTDCGEKYRLSRLEGVQEGPAVWFISGTAFHSGCDTMDQLLWEEGR